MQRRSGKTKDAILDALADSGPLTSTGLLAECPEVPSLSALHCCLAELRRQGLVRSEPHRRRGRGRSCMYRLA